MTTNDGDSTSTIDHCLRSIERIDKTAIALGRERARLTRLIADAGVCAYQGVPGAFSEEAAIALAGPDAPLRPMATLDDVFDALIGGLVAQAVVPVENTIAGAVPGCAERLTHPSIRVRRECALHIRQALVACPSARLGDITRVLSHPVALAQCGAFLAAHPRMTPVATFDTAGAVREIAHAGRLNAAAIAGARAAGLYGAVVLEDEVQDRHENYTRFVLIEAVGAKR